MSVKVLNQAGDTIVEIMIVLAILGMAIGISYSTANRSLLAARGAQENSEATQIAQAQVEYLRAYAKNDPGDANDIFITASPFCVSTTGQVTKYTSATPPGECMQGTPNRYQISINCVQPEDRFTVKVTWPDIEGQGQDSVTLIYRVHHLP